MAALPPAPPRPAASSLPSLRRRLGGWIAAVLALSLIASTTLRILDERRRVLASAREGAVSLVERLAATPEVFRSGARARSEIDTLNRLIRPWSARIDLVPSGTPPPPGTALLVSRPVELPEGRLELRYHVSEAYLAAAAWRAVIFHVVHGALTFLLLLAGIEWILRRRLRAPLHQLSHQIERMRAGGGWEPVLPALDAEIAEIASAVRGLGPGLAAQVDEWIQAERRAAVAMALGGLRKRLVESRRRALLRLDLHQPRSRSPARELAAVERLIDSVEDDMLQLGRGGRAAAANGGGVAPRSRIRARGTGPASGSVSHGRRGRAGPPS